jgi:hypothetical protein
MVQLTKKIVFSHKFLNRFGPGANSIKLFGCKSNHSFRKLDRFIVVFWFKMVQLTKETNQFGPKLILEI